MVESSYSDDMLEQIVDGKEIFPNFITHAPNHEVIVIKNGLVVIKTVRTMGRFVLHMQISFIILL